ncbi:MAG: HlyD family efflux transporter periplasmic adaptor subunit [Bacteroidales bacterium]|nr:HlyD family efflux transporter periplasmic adaptor subunit [Bacteroidales bacterium]
MNWRKTIISILAIIIMIALGFFLNGMFSGMAKSPEEKQKEELLLYVKTQKVEYSSNSSKIIETGRLASQQTVDLSSEVQGQILPGEVVLKEGTRFSKGELIVHIFDDEAKNNLKAGKSRFMNSLAGILPDIRIDFPESYDKYQIFFNSIKIDDPLPELPQLDSDKEKVFLASRNILNDYYNIKSAEIRLGKYKLFAPFDGTFTSVYLEPGSVANPGSRIASMIRTDKHELEVPVRVEDAIWIDIGDAVKVSTKDRLLHWQGKVVRKSDFMDPSSQTIAVFVSLSPEKDKPLYQGQYLKAEFASKTLENSMEVPRNAVFNKDRVFTVIDGKLKENQVNILKANETSVIISGLPVGADLVIEPLVNAKEGFNAEILK